MCITICIYIYIYVMHGQEMKTNKYGGPCIQGDNVIGVAFQAYSNKQNIGYIIPVPVIEHFLEGIKRKNKSLNFPSIGMSWSKLENPSHKASLQMREEQTGIFVNHLIPLTDAFDKLKPNDVVLRYDGIVIADDGTISFRDVLCVCVLFCRCYNII
ncbi:hypothetical protein RFI_19300 [Reticulomyxa filosa]|uniref:Peptidase S1 domain-containing protein n=1 Tax=Reticulomyxa filosa TaxID=46433 RepID=X6MY37_RETFI|nr:hypothetical protein RFI_19300 [Reticulomyxa filosa]|eukprot:ETO17995.1 hypothetical protein RFI_19300 [Reticulomyxa filosa]